MALVFFVSSVGDTDLAKATIIKLIENNSNESIFLVPLTATAIERTKELAENQKIRLFPLKEILNSPPESQTILSSEELEKIEHFINEHNITRAYVGVPSPLNEEIPFYIAKSLKIPCTIAYEYMFFAPESHCFWKHVDALAAHQNCNFAVPLQTAKADILKINSHAQIHTIGHLSIDRALSSPEKLTDNSYVRISLGVKSDEELIFISGTTQPVETDSHFLEALLKELSSQNYPHLQIRFGLHPGVKDLDDYLRNILEICGKFPETKNQFKIILPSQFEAKLQTPIHSPILNEFILKVDISGVQAGQAADKIGQAVPGALLNEAALKGKPAYFHEKSSSPYLPKSCFSENISYFFSTKTRPPIPKEELELQEEAPNLLAKLMNH